MSTKINRNGFIHQCNECGMRWVRWDRKGTVEFSNEDYGVIAATDDMIETTQDILRSIDNKERNASFLKIDARERANNRMNERDES